MSTLNRRARLVVHSLGAVAASAVAGLLLATWPALLAEYDAWKLEQARTYEEAKSWLVKLEGDAGRGAAGSLLSRLRRGTSFATFWFFAYGSHPLHPAPG